MFGRSMRSGDCPQYPRRRFNPYVAQAPMPVGRGWHPVSYSEPYPAMIDEPGYLMDYPSGYREHPYPMNSKRGYHTPFKPVDPYDLRCYEAWNDPAAEAYYYPRGRERGHMTDNQYAYPGWSPYSGDEAFSRKPFYERDPFRRPVSPQYVTLSDVLRDALEDGGKGFQRLDEQSASPPGQYVLLDDAQKKALQSPQFLRGAKGTDPSDEKVDRPVILVPSSYLANGDDSKISPLRVDSTSLPEDSIYVPLNIPVKPPFSKENRSESQRQLEPVYVIRPDLVQSVHSNPSKVDKEGKSQKDELENGYPVVYLPGNALASLLNDKSESKAPTTPKTDQSQILSQPNVKLIPVKQQDESPSTISGYRKSEVKPESSASEGGYPVFYIPASLLKDASLSEKSPTSVEGKHSVQSHPTRSNIRIVPVTQAHSDGADAEVLVRQQAESYSALSKAEQVIDAKEHKSKHPSYMEEQPIVTHKKDKPRLKKIFSPETAASLIQSVYRGYLVRRTQPLKYLKEISRVRSKLKELQSQVSKKEELRRVCSNPHERLRLTEGIMALLLQLDVIQGVHPVVREVRKSAARELIQLQDTVDNAIKQLSQKQVNSSDSKVDEKATDVEVANSASGIEIRKPMSNNFSDVEDDPSTAEVVTTIINNSGDGTQVTQPKDGADCTNVPDLQMANIAEDQSMPKEMSAVSAPMGKEETIGSIVPTAHGDEVPETSFENDAVTAENLVPSDVQIQNYSSDHGAVNGEMNKSDGKQRGTVPFESVLGSQRALSASSSDVESTNNVDHESETEISIGNECQITPHLCIDGEPVVETCVTLELRSDVTEQDAGEIGVLEVSHSPSRDTMNDVEDADGRLASALLQEDSELRDSGEAVIDASTIDTSHAGDESPSKHFLPSSSICSEIERGEEEMTYNECKSGGGSSQPSDSIETVSEESNSDVCQRLCHGAGLIEESESPKNTADVKMENEVNLTQTETVCGEHCDKTIGELPCGSGEESPVPEDSLSAAGMDVVCIDESKENEVGLVHGDFTFPTSTSEGEEGNCSSDVPEVSHSSGDDAKITLTGEPELSELQQSIRNSEAGRFEDNDLADLAASLELTENLYREVPIVEENQGHLKLMQDNSVHEYDNDTNVSMKLPEKPSEVCKFEISEAAFADEENGECRHSSSTEDSDYNTTEDVKNVCYTGSMSNNESLKLAATKLKADACKRAQESVTDVSQAPDTVKGEASNAQLLRVLSEENKMLKSLVNELMHCGKLQALSILHLQERLGRLETLCSLRKPQKSKNTAKSKVSKKK